MNQRPRLWVYKNRSYQDVYQIASGDWTEFFDEYADTHEPVQWGGSWATSKPSQKRLFEEEMQIRDLILCWQTDRKAAIGIARISRITESHTGNMLWLKAEEHFANPVRLHEMKRTTHPQLRSVDALRSGPIATIYPTTSKEARLLLTACASPLASQY